MAIRKIGSNLDVKGMVIHQLKKDAGVRNVTFKKARNKITITEKEQVFVGKLNESYRKKSNPTYGIFGGENPTFKELLRRYLTDHKFYDFSVAAAKEYEKILKTTISATGGFLILIDFLNKDNNSRYLLILTTNNKDGYVVVEDDLTLKDIKNLDLSKVDVACMVNLTTWQTIDSGADATSQTYLSFVKGKKGVSFYFMNFIDCDNKTTNAESTRRLTQALDAYTKQKEYDRPQAIRAKNTVYEYCMTCMKEKREIQLSAISALLDPENKDEFLEFASDEDYGVSETIKGDSTQLRRIKYVKYKNENYTVEFDTKLLGTEVIYNRQKNELTFKRVPQELSDQIPK